MSLSATSTKTASSQHGSLLLDPTQISPKLPVQESFTIILSGKTLTIATLVLTLLIQQNTIWLARIALFVVPILLYVRHDYQNFLRMGPGGIPSTPQGYLKTVWLRLFALRNPLISPPLKQDYIPTHGLLGKHDLPKRSGSRPVTGGIAPHRQLDQPGSLHCFHALRKTLKEFASSHRSDFDISTSRLEKHGLALFSRQPLAGARANGEICHVHDTDLSLHLFLHPEDIAEVIEKGWGEKHPMSWEWGAWKPVVGPYFVLIYAPRNEDELRTVCKIIEAAAYNISGKQVKVDSALGGNR